MAEVQLQDMVAVDQRSPIDTVHHTSGGSGFSAQRAMTASYLCAMAVMAAALVLALTGNDTTARVILGMASVLFIPGYLLVGAVFPGAGDLPLALRGGLSVGVSIALQAFLGAFLGWGPWQISRLSVLVVSTVFALLTGAFAVVQSALTADTTSRFRDLGRRSPAIVVVLVIAAGVILWSAHYVDHTAFTMAPVTEFYVASAENQDPEYPSTAAPGESMTVTFGIENQEQRPVRYQIIVQQGDRSIGASPTIPLENGQRWVGPITFRLPTNETSGTEVPIDVRLFVDDNKTYIRTLRFWITVNPDHQE